MYSAVLTSFIEKEIAHEEYIYNDHDEKLLNCMLKELNTIGYSFRYLAEFESCTIPSISAIVRKYIYQFSDISTQVYLLYPAIADRNACCADLTLDLYRTFKVSKYYIPSAGQPAPAHICCRLDQGFRKLKPKNHKMELTTLVSCPRDAHYLPFTVQMLASWKIPQIRDLLCFYMNSNNITLDSVGLTESSGEFYPSLSYIKNSLRFTAIHGLRHFPSEEVVSILSACLQENNSDIVAAANRSLAFIQKRSSHT